MGEPECHTPTSRCPRVRMMTGAFCPPAVRVVSVIGRVVTIRVCDKASPTGRSKAPGARGAEIWSHVGSTNFDERSLALNEEVGVGILDAGVAGELKAAFNEDLRDSKEITREQWRRRPISDRIKEMAARLTEYWI